MLAVSIIIKEKSVFCERVSIIMMLFLKGVMIGLVFGVPIGAVGALTIRRTITYGAKAGFISGIGCSTADLCYSCISVFGVTLISDFILRYQSIISMMGGIIVVIMGICFIRKKQTPVQETSGSAKLISFFSSSFIIAITNPATIITFMMAFTIFNIAQVSSAAEGMTITIGILLGTCIWWAAISVIIGNLRGHLTEKKLLAVNYILGVLVLLFGLAILVKSLYSF